MYKKKPDRLYIRALYENDFKRLLEKDSPLASKTNKHIFLLAMMKGFILKNRVKLDKKKGVVRAEYLNKDDESILKAIAIYEEKNIKILGDPSKIYSIAEEYASGGIRNLKEEVLGKYHGSYIKKLETELVEKAEKIIKGK